MSLHDLLYAYSPQLLFHCAVHNISTVQHLFLNAPAGRSCWPGFWAQCCFWSWSVSSATRSSAWRPISSIASSPSCSPSSPRRHRWPPAEPSCAAYSPLCFCAGTGQWARIPCRMYQNVQCSLRVPWPPPPLSYDWIWVKFESLSDLLNSKSYWPLHLESFTLTLHYSTYNLYISLSWLDIL